ncbi:MAG: hypothetical protein ABW115_22590 [Candidatus Thiodiazotropha sp. 6PLUC6]
MEFPDLELCRAGYSRNLKGEPAPQTFDAWQRQRRKVRHRGVTDTVCFVCNHDQCQALEQFHRSAGGDWFTIELPDYTGVAATIARFDGSLTIKPVRDRFEVTAQLYLPQPPVIPKDELEQFLLNGMGITERFSGRPGNLSCVPVIPKLS